MHELFLIGNRILGTLETYGYKGYFVGGCVRDHHMKRAINDVDITTDALPDDIERIFERTVDVGKEHGTIIVLIDDIPFEVTTFRTESGYSDFRRPDQVSFTNQLNSDLERRDFTMNAMAMDENFEIFDPYGGMKDIEERVIRTVGCPEERFNEDALRMLRAARFAAHLEFHVASETENAMAAHAKNLEFVAVERCVVELDKLYRGAGVKAAKALMVKTRLKAHLAFLENIGDEDFLDTDVRSLENEVALQMWRNPALEPHLHELKLSNDMKREIKDTTRLIEMLHGPNTIKEIAYGHDMEILKNAYEIVELNTFTESKEKKDLLKSAIELKPQLPISDISDINLDGNMLMKLFNARGGRWIRKVFSAVEEKILDGSLENDTKIIMEWVEANVEYEAGDIEITEE